MTLIKNKDFDIGRTKKAYLIFQMYATEGLAKDDAKILNGEFFVTKELTEEQIKRLLNMKK